MCPDVTEWPVESQNNFFQRLRAHRNKILFILDFLVITLSMYLAFWVRFEGVIPGNYLNMITIAIPLALAIKLIVFVIFHIYRFSYKLPIEIAANPINKNFLKELKEINHENVLIFISNVSISRPGYTPPFSIHHKSYPTVNMNFSEKNYELLYDEGTKIFKFIE